MDKKYFVIDFDSTFITLEGLDELARVALKQTPEKIAEIEQITKDGMVGKIGFLESLERRIKGLGASIKDLNETAKKLKKNITPSVLRNKKFFKQNSDRIYIVTGGFEELVWPVVEAFGISKNHILANKFLFKAGRVIGFDKSRVTSEAQGKANAVKNLDLNGEVIVIGDGFTDLEIKRLNHESGIMNHARMQVQSSVIPHLMRNPEKTDWIPGQARDDNPKTTYKFVAFVENVSRESIISFP